MVAARSSSRGLAARGTRPTRDSCRGNNSTSQESRGTPAGRTGRERAWRGATVTAKDEATALLANDEQDSPFLEVEELQTLASDGRERGFLTFEEIATCLEEVEVTKEQISEFRAHLVEAGVDIVAQDGRPAPAGVSEAPPGPGPDGTSVPKKP